MLLIVEVADEEKNPLVNNFKALTNILKGRKIFFFVV